jgi:hypothetical protein
MGLGTTDALITVIENIADVIDKKNSGQIVCLDFSKAFDKLQPSILLNKLASLEVNKNICNIINSFLSDRTQLVKMNNNSSTLTSMEVGTPQGTKMGPVLWIIYISDLLKDQDGVTKYADDVTNVAAEHQQQYMDLALSWSNDNGMELNKAKTMAIPLGTGNTGTLTIDDQQISSSNHTKLLGIVLDSKLDFKEHISSVISKCNTRMYQMRKLKQLGLNTDGLLKFYISNIRSILVYACPAWYTLVSKTDFSRLDRVQRKATKIILPQFESYTARLENLNLEELDSFISKTSYSHFLSILSNPDHLVHRLLHFNQNRRSGRLSTLFKIPRTKRVKRDKTFIYFYMKFYNNNS